MPVGADVRCARRRAGRAPVARLGLRGSTPGIRWLVGACTLAILGATSAAYAPGPPVLRIPVEAEHVALDGRLDEAAYRTHIPLTAFVAAGAPRKRVPATKAWVFWSTDRLVVAFDVEDRTPAGAGSAPMADEHVVDGEDRVEAFLWSGDARDPYYCIEIAYQGHAHDYMARFYRKFDDTWTPAGWNYGVAVTSNGYTVELSLSKAAIEAMGQKLVAGRTFRLGLFRADFPTLNGDPTWITWVDRKGEPDFHVAESFGTAVLSGRAGR